MQADLVFRGARVADGDRPPRLADVAVSGGQIVAVAERLPLDSCGELVEANGLLVCPGFIDMHAHSALRIFTDPLLTPKLAQGFTTEVICPDGLGPAPLRPSGWKERQRYLAEGPGPEQWTWESMAGYLAAVEGARPATNVVPSVPHSAVRCAVLGPADRRPERGEMAQMQEEVSAGLAAGARVLSFGLIYAPGLCADTAELESLAKAAAEYDTPLMPHVRNEAAGVLDAIGEFVQVAEHAGAPLHISHLKLAGSPELLENLLHLAEDAAQGVDLTFDQYRYGAGSTLLTALLPPWALAGGPAVILRRLGEGHERRRMLRDMERGLPGWENLYRCCGPAGITITEAAGARSGDVGKNLEQIVGERGGDPAAAMLELLADTDLNRVLCQRLGLDPVEVPSWDALVSRIAQDADLALVAATDGNHGRALARVARLLGLAAHILVPADMAAARRDALIAEGAEVTVIDGGYDDAIAASADLADDQHLVVSDASWPGYTKVPAWVIEGYSTLTSEILTQLEQEHRPQPSVAAVQVGVGAFAASVARCFPDTPTRIVGVEPTAADCMLASVEAGCPVRLSGRQDSIMAGLNCGSPSLVAWPEVSAGLDAFAAAEDYAAEEAMRLLARDGIVSGESGAAGLAGPLAYAGDLGLTEHDHILVISTEGPTDPSSYVGIATTETVSGK